MNREELLQVAKPILFNTKMVLAILDGRKTVTRRAVRYKYDNTEMEMKTDKYGTHLIEIQKDIEGETYGTRKDGTTWRKIRGYIEKKPPYRRGDILYVRETFAQVAKHIFWYRSTPPKDCENILWRPSIHMPKEAARIFLQVRNVRVERLQDMTAEDCKKEGGETDRYLDMQEEAGICGIQCETLKDYFAYSIWDSVVPKQELNKYGWDANPWVWVIEFERLEVGE